MFNKKVQISKISCAILSILFFNKMVFALDLKNVNLDLTKKTIEQKTESLLSQDGLKTDKNTSSFKDLTEVLNQADQLCQDLKKQLSWYFKIWSKISRNPVFENQLSQSIEKLQHQLLLYNNSDGKEGKIFSKEKLSELVVLMSQYKKLKNELNEKSVFINYFEQPFFKSVSNGFGWIGKKIQPALELCLALAFFVPLCATVLGVTDTLYFGDLKAFFYPFTFLKNFFRLGTTVTTTTVGSLAVLQAELTNAVYGDNWFAKYLEFMASAFCKFQNILGGKCVMNTK